MQKITPRNATQPATSGRPNEKINLQGINQFYFFRLAWPRSGQKGMKGYESGDFGGDSV